MHHRWSVARTWHNYAVALLPLAFPLYLVRFSVVSIPVTLLEVLTYFLFASYLFFEFREMLSESSVGHAMRAQLRGLFRKKRGDGVVILLFRLYFS